MSAFDNNNFLLPPPVALCLLVVLGTTIFIEWRARLNGLPFPPGPRSKPFIGNLFDIPVIQPWVTYADWGRQYGSVVHARIFRQHIVVINSLQDAVELLEKRSNNYSDRPIYPILDLMGWDFNVALMPYGSAWRLHRRLMQQSFSKHASLSYQPTQVRKVHEMLQGLLSSPDELTVHCRTVAAAIVMATIYEYDILPKNDHLVQLAEQSVAKLTEYMVPGSMAVNALPILRSLPSGFPGTGFRRFAKDCKVLTDEMQDAPFKYVKARMFTNKKISATVSRLLERNDARGGLKEEEDAIKRIAATGYAAGADTTVSALGTFFYAMCLYPPALKKAQEEIDTVVGTHRLPTYDDRASLPYVEALYREVLRWRPVLPLGVPHATTQDDVYNGYFIPKGSIVFSNIWAMSRDELKYSDPELFHPERFIHANGHLNDDDVSMVFGFGRRICVGRHMADATVWLTIASVLSVFDITKAHDEAGNEIPIEGGYTDALISQPLPYRSSITPRSEGARRLIAEANC